MKKIVDIAAMRAKKGPAVPKKLRATEKKTVKLKDERFKQMFWVRMRQGDSVAQVMADSTERERHKWEVLGYEGLLKDVIERAYAAKLITERQQNDLLENISDVYWLAWVDSHGMEFNALDDEKLQAYIEKREAELDAKEMQQDEKPKRKVR